MPRIIAAILAAFISLVVASAQFPADRKALFEKRCGGCHALDRDKEGPRLGGVYGRTAGSVHLVTVVTDDTTKTVRVTLGAVGDVLTQITSGVKPGDVVAMADLQQPIFPYHSRAHRLSSSRI